MSNFKDARVQVAAERLAARGAHLLPNHNPDIVRLELLPDGRPIEQAIVAWWVAPDIAGDYRHYGEPVLARRWHPNAERPRNGVGSGGAWCVYDRRQDATLDGWAVAAGLTKAEAIEALRVAEAKREDGAHSCGAAQ